MGWGESRQNADIALALLAELVWHGPTGEFHNTDNFSPFLSHTRMLDGFEYILK